MDKKCSACKKIKSIEDFHNNRSEKDGKMRWCKKCNLERVRVYQKNNPKKYVYTRDRLYKRHGINKEIFDNILTKQKNKCAICVNDFDLEKEKNIVIDHDHSCCEGQYSCGKCVRGLLCQNCNHGLGKFKDNKEFLKNAIKYLE